MLPRAILFDLDETLIRAYGRPDEAWAAVVAEFARDLGELPHDRLTQTIAAYAREFWADSTQHRYWRQRLLAARREVVAGALARLAAEGHRVPAAEVSERLADRFSAMREEQASLFPDALAVVDALRGRGVRLALVTNGAGDMQRAKIDRFDLAHRFHHIQIEGEHGFGKPEERAYRHALETLGVEAAHTWMIGDNLEWEVAAPQRLGIHAIWYDPAGGGLPPGTTVRPDRIIGALSELLPSAE
jgi:putative hydrolase of the HAD superfamily